MTDCIRRRHSYWTTCPCTNCRPDKLMAHKRHSAGINYRIPNDTAWETLAAKIDAGWTARAIGSATGLDPQNQTNGRLYFSRHLAQYKRGHRVYLGPTVAHAIVNMTRPTAGQVGAEPSRRRLRALAAIGHGLNTLTTETGIKFSTLAMIRSNKAVRCAAVNANLIADTYARLHMTIGDDEQATRIAREKRWPAPMSWNNIDDLHERPTGVGSGKLRQTDLDPAMVHRAMTGGTKPRNLTNAEAGEVVRRALAAGMSTTAIERLYGLKVERYQKVTAA